MSKRTLLLADDSVTIQKVVNLTFADEGIDVITVGDGDSAMQKISEVSPDVVLADVHMPGLNGYQICEIVRDNPMTRNLPVVLLVGSFEPFDEGEAARVGANAYLTKPFQSIRQLVTQVTDLMQSASPVEPQPEIEQPAPETPEQPSSGEVKDTTDIEALYHQSFGAAGTEMQTSAPEPAAAEESYNAYGDQTYSDSQTDIPSTPYVDAGMDDEMIETSHVGGIEQPPPASDYFESDYQAQAQSDQPPPASDYVHTDYQAQAQFEQAHITSPDEELTSDEQYSPESSLAAEQNSYGETQETGWATPADQPPSHGAFDTYAEDRSESTVGEATTRQPEVEFDEFSRTEQIPASITASAFDLDDLEILDLPPLEDGKTQEFTATERSGAEGGGKEIVSMSSELMDILVQRVVDKLSKDK